MKFLKTFSVIIVIFIASCSNNNAWQEAKSEGTIESYTIFIEENSDNEFVKIAEHKLDSLITYKDSSGINIALEVNTIEAFDKYLTENPEGNYIEQAKLQKEKLLIIKEETDFWNNAKTLNTIDNYNNYLTKYPKGEYTNNALKGIFLINNSDFISKYKNIVSFYEVLASRGDLSRLSKYFSSDVVYFQTEGGDYFHQDTIKAPYSKETFSKYGYWNVSGNSNLILFYKGSENPQDEYEKCEFGESEDGETFTVYISYSDNGAIGHFATIWSNIDNEGYKIVESIITLPNFM